MQQAIKAYRHVSATEEFRSLERMLSDIRHNEASALGHARREGIYEGINIGKETEREKWHGIVAEKDAQIAELLARLGDKQ